MRGLVIALALLGAAAVQAAGRFEPASLQGEQETGDPLLRRCVYQTLGGYRFSVVMRSLCPITVRVNPETGEVLR
jgi:hypothetical protein